MDTTAFRRIKDLARERATETSLIGFGADLKPQILDWQTFGGEVGRIVEALLAQTDPVPTARVIAVDAANTPDSVLQMVAVLCAGMPLLPVNPRAPEPERRRLFDVVTACYAPVFGLDEHLELRPLAVSPGLVSEPPSRTPNISYLLPTGGSSGGMKVVAQPGPFRYDPQRIPSPFYRYLGWRTGQRQLVVGPLHHAASFTSLIDGVWDANITLLQPVFSPGWTIRLIRDYAVEWVQLTPAYMRAIIQLAEPDRADLVSLRAVVHTAAPCDDLTKRAWLNLVGPQRVYEYYGATEQIGITTVRGDEWLIRPGTVGKGRFTQIRILDEAGRRLPPSAVGRVFMRVASSRRRTYLDGRRFAAVTVDGFVSVGDYGWLDDEGYLFLSPRRHDLINVGGENVFPDELEAVLLEHPDVRDAVAVAMPDPVLGSVVRVYAALRAPEAVDGATLLAYCRERLSGHKVPRRVDIVDEIPRSSTGKLERWRVS